MKFSRICQIQQYKKSNPGVKRIINRLRLRKNFPSKLRVKKFYERRIWIPAPKFGAGLRRCPAQTSPGERNRLNYNGVCRGNERSSPNGKLFNRNASRSRRSSHRFSRISQTVRSEFLSLSPQLRPIGVTEWSDERISRVQSDCARWSECGLSENVSPKSIQLDLPAVG